MGRLHHTQRVGTSQAMGKAPVFPSLLHSLEKQTQGISPTSQKQCLFPCHKTASGYEGTSRWYLFSLPHRYMHLYSPAITCTCNPVKSCPLMGGSCTLKGKLESRRRLGRSGVHSPVHWGGPLGSQPCRPGNWCQAAPSPRGGSTCGVVEHAVRVDGGLVGWRRVIGLVDVRVLECGVWGWRVMEVESPAFSVVRKV